MTTMIDSSTMSVGKRSAVIITRENRDGVPALTVQSQAPADMHPELLVYVFLPGDGLMLDTYRIATEVADRCAAMVRRPGPAASGLSGHAFLERLHNAVTSTEAVLRSGSELAFALEMIGEDP